MRDGVSCSWNSQEARVTRSESTSWSVRCKKTGKVVRNEIMKDLECQTDNFLFDTEGNKEPLEFTK